MKLLLLLFICAFVIYKAQSHSEKCFDEIEECHTTNYEQYVNCIRRRQKRSVDCDSPCDSDNCINTCNECDCSSCSYSTCQNSCDSCCSTCCSNYNACNNNHCCHKTCHAQCRSSSCRSSCRKSCYDRIRNLDEQSVGNTNTNSSNENKHNITTIIHLNNVINNTNIIDIPIVLNNTNHNNITLYQNENSRASNSSENCCTVISPRQCVPQNEYPYSRCFHYRSRQCGNYCTAPIVHKEQQQICQTAYPGSAPSCRQSVIYIPQPQPRCTYQSTWPYVYCGIPRSASCNGCYGHYVNPNSQDYVNCPSGCYDEGFGVGPYYRQGPVYRPTYTHAPCFSCFGSGGYGGFGGYEGFGGYAAPYGGYPGLGGLPGYGGYPGTGGYSGYGGGYPPVGGYPSNPALTGSDAMPYGSWEPEIENTYEQVKNSSDLNINPLFSSYPNLLPNPYVGDRVGRELEIELNYLPKSTAHAEVKIKKADLDEKKKMNETELGSSTQATTKDISTP